MKELEERVVGEREEVERVVGERVRMEGEVGEMEARMRAMEGERVGIEEECKQAREDLENTQK